MIDAGVESDYSLGGASSSVTAPPSAASQPPPPADERTAHAVAMALAHARVQHAAELNRQRQTLTSQYTATLKATEAALQARVNTLEQRMAEHEATERVANARTLALTRDAKFQTRQAREEARSEIASLRQSAEEAATRARRLTSVLARAEADNEKWKAAADEAKSKAEQLQEELEQAKQASRPRTPEGPPPTRAQPPPALDTSGSAHEQSSSESQPPSTPSNAPPAAQATAALTAAQAEIRSLRQQVVALTAQAADADSQLQEMQSQIADSQNRQAQEAVAETSTPTRVEAGTAMTPPSSSSQGGGGSPASEGDEESATVKQLRSEIARLDMALASATTASAMGGLSPDDMLPGGGVSAHRGALRQGGRPKGQHHSGPCPSGGCTYLIFSGQAHPCSCRQGWQLLAYSIQSRI